MRALLIPAITKFLGGLRFRSLFIIGSTIFLLDLFNPALLVGMPFDEIFLAVITLVLSQWKRRNDPVVPEVPAADAKAVIDLPPDQVRREG